MRLRPLRTLIAAAATLGLVAAIAPVALAINGRAADAGLEAAADAGAEAAGRAAIADERSRDGEPDWLPGPPPWVFDLIDALHPDGMPAASIFGSAEADADAEGSEGAATDAAVSAGSRAGAAGGAAAGQVTLPDQAAAAAGAAVGGGTDAGTDDADAEVTIEISAGASGRVVVPPIGGGE